MYIYIYIYFNLRIILKYFFSALVTETKSPDNKGITCFINNVWHVSCLCSISMLYWMELLQEIQKKT